MRRVLLGLSGGLLLVWGVVSFAPSSGSVIGTRTTAYDDVRVGAGPCEVCTKTVPGNCATGTCPGPNALNRCHEAFEYFYAKKNLASVGTCGKVNDPKKNCPTPAAINCANVYRCVREEEEGKWVCNPGNTVKPGTAVNANSC